MSIVLGLAGVPVKVTLPLTEPAISRLGHSNRRNAAKSFVDRILRLLLQNLISTATSFGHPGALHRAGPPGLPPGQRPWFQSLESYRLRRAALRSLCCDG